MFCIRYYKNAVKKLKAEEEAKYRLKVSEVLQKERDTYGKLAETEKRLIEQQEIIEKEIASREDQLKTLSSALRKQHEAISERLSQLQVSFQQYFHHFSSRNLIYLLIIF